MSEKPLTTRDILYYLHQNSADLPPTVQQLTNAILGLTAIPILTGICGENTRACANLLDKLQTASAQEFRNFIQNSDNGLSPVRVSPKGNGINNEPLPNTWIIHNDSPLSPDVGREVYITIRYEPDMERLVFF